MQFSIMRIVWLVFYTINGEFLPISEKEEGGVGLEERTREEGGVGLEERTREKKREEGGVGLGERTRENKREQDRRRGCGLRRREPNKQQIQMQYTAIPFCQIIKTSRMQRSS